MPHKGKSQGKSRGAAKSTPRKLAAIARRNVKAKGRGLKGLKR